MYKLQSKCIFDYGIIMIRTFQNVKTQRSIIVPAKRHTFIKPWEVTMENLPRQREKVPDEGSEVWIIVVWQKIDIERQIWNLPDHLRKLKMSIRLSSTCKLVELENISKRNNIKYPPNNSKQFSVICVQHHYLSVIFWHYVYNKL